MTEPHQDWDEIEALRESLREHMAEIHRLRAALAENALQRLTDVHQEIEATGQESRQAEPVVDPVGSLSVRYHRGSGSMANAEFDYYGDLPEGDYALYTAPPAAQRKPLTDEEIHDCFQQNGKLYQMAELAPRTLERFAALVAAAEREECAKVAEQMLRHYTQAVTGVSEAIRARGKV
jgi:hypothetical protein